MMSLISTIGSKLVPLLLLLVLVVVPPAAFASSLSSTRKKFFAQGFATSVFIALLPVIFAPRGGYGLAFLYLIVLWIYLSLLFLAFWVTYEIRRKHRQFPDTVSGIAGLNWTSRVTAVLAILSVLIVIIQAIATTMSAPPPAPPVPAIEL